MKQLYTHLKVALTFVVLVASFNSFSQNVGINSTGAAPNASAGLDVNFPDKGVLIPNVALTGTNDVSTISSPATSLLVYNTVTANSLANKVTPGYYYYTGAEWARLNTQFSTSDTDISYTAGSVNVGTSTADASALLNVNATNKGVLIPRVALTGTDDVTTILSPTTSLLIYNTANANGVTPGYYYFTEAAAWTRISNGSGSGWGITGNTGTNSASNFIGTTDAQDLVFKTAGAERLRIDNANGNLGIGVTPYVESRVAIDGGTIATTDGLGTVVSVYAERNQFVEFNIQNGDSGNSASTDIVATNDAGTDYANYIDMGINSSSYSNNKSNILNKANLAYIYSNSSANLKIGNGGIGKNLVFFTNPSTGSLGNLTANGTERMKITGDGKVGIGEFVDNNGDDVTVAEKLTVDGKVVPRTTNTYDLGRSDLRWATVYATNLNVTNSSFSSHLTPGTTNSYDLGSSSLYWNNGYINSLTTSGASNMGTILPLTNGATDFGANNKKWGTIYYTTLNNGSDRRLKTNIEALKYGLNEVIALQPVSYNYKSNPGDVKRLGLIAQELKPVIPELVSGDESKETLGVNYVDLIPVLINAIKEQQKQIEDLKKVVADLQKK